MSLKVAIVTGAGRGIGRAIALRLASDRLNLALVGRNETHLDEVRAQCCEKSVRCEVFPYDLAQISGIEALVERIHRTFGRLDAVVNNAGVYEGGKGDSADLGAWDAALDINLRAVVHLNRYALPYIEQQGGGSIIHISSISGRMTHGGGGSYCATKHGLMGYSGSLFDDVREKNVKVCAICPGFVATDMPSAAHARDRMIRPEAIADAVAFVMSFDASGCPTEIVIRPQMPMN